MLVATQFPPFFICECFSEVSHFQTVIKSVFLRFIHKVHFAYGTGLIAVFGKVMGNGARVGG